jgi:hypothetical protein
MTGRLGYSNGHVHQGICITGQEIKRRLTYDMDRHLTKTKISSAFKNSLYIFSAGVNLCGENDLRVKFIPFDQQQNALVLQPCFTRIIFGKSFEHTFLIILTLSCNLLPMVISQRCGDKSKRQTRTEKGELCRHFADIRGLKARTKRPTCEV